MGITYFQPPPMLPDEVLRERAVEASGALDMRHDPVLRRIVDATRRRFRTSMGAISIVYRDWQYLIAASGLPEGPYSRRTSFCGHAILDGNATFCVPDAAADERFADNPVVVDDPSIRFYAGAPLVGADNLPLGTICVFDHRPRECFSAHDDQMLRAATREVMARIEERGHHDVDSRKAVGH